MTILGRVFSLFSDALEREGLCFRFDNRRGEAGSVPGARFHADFPADER